MGRKKKTLPLLLKRQFTLIQKPQKKKQTIYEKRNIRSFTSFYGGKKEKAEEEVEESGELLW